jgi:hypothetical protein
MKEQKRKTVNLWVVKGLMTIPEKEGQACVTENESQTIRQRYVISYIFLERAYD